MRVWLGIIGEGLEIVLAAILLPRYTWRRLTAKSKRFDAISEWTWPREEQYPDE